MYGLYGFLILGSILIDEQGTDAPYKSFNIVVFVVSIFVEWILIMVFTNLVQLMNCLRSSEHSTTILFGIDAIALIIAFVLTFPWPLVFNTNTKFIDNTSNSFTIILCLAAFAYAHILLIYFLTTVAKLHDKFKFIRDRSRVKLIFDIENKMVMESTPFLHSAIDVVKYHYNTIRKISWNLIVFLSLASIEFIISTIYMFYLLYNDYEYNILTLLLSTMSVLPFGCILLLVIIYNDHIMRLNDDLKIVSNLEITIFNVLIYHRFVISIATSFVSFVLKNFK